MMALKNHDFPEIVFSDHFIALRRQIKLPFLMNENRTDFVSCSRVFQSI